MSELIRLKATCGKTTRNKSLNINNVNDIIKDKSINEMFSFLLAEDAKTKIISKNMFLIYSNSYLDKKLVYEQYGYAQNFNNSYVYEKGETVKQNEKLYTCLNSTFDKVSFDYPLEYEQFYWKEENVLFKGNLYKKTDDINYWENIDINISDKRISEVFNIKNENNNYYISIKLYDDENEIYIFDKENTKSIQYWYLYKGSLHFVFGVNFPDKENNPEEYNKVWNEDKELKIYISMLSTRDMRIYDEKNRLVGKSLNLAEKKLPPYASIEQYYDVPEVPKYTLNYNSPAEINFMIERKVSPYGGGKTGTLNSGDGIYWGDVIYTFAEIIGEASSVEIFVNGKDETKQITYLGKDITVKSDLNIEINVKPFEYIEVPIDQSIMPITFITQIETQYEKSQYVSLPIYKSSDLIKKVRISGTFNYVENGETKVYDFENIEAELGEDFFTFGNDCILRVTYSSNLWEYQIHCYGTPNSYGENITITKFEEYK